MEPIVDYNLQCFFFISENQHENVVLTQLSCYKS